jgi:hypothetical protein
VLLSAPQAQIRSNIAAIRAASDGFEQARSERDEIAESCATLLIWNLSKQPWYFEYDLRFRSPQKPKILLHWARAGDTQHSPD